MDSIVYVIPIMAIIGLVVMAVKSAWVSKQDAGSAEMKELSDHIHSGAMAFLKAEWKVLGYNRCSCIFHDCNDLHVKHTRHGSFGSNCWRNPILLALFTTPNSMDSCRGVNWLAHCHGSPSMGADCACKCSRRFY